MPSSLDVAKPGSQLPEPSFFRVPAEGVQEIKGAFRYTIYRGSERWLPALQESPCILPSFLDSEAFGFEAIHNVNSNSSIKIQLVGECVQAVEVCNILSDGLIQVVPPTEHTIFITQ